MNPVCKLTPSDRFAIDVLFQVARTLREAHLEKRLDSFLRRAQEESTYEGMVELAGEYVTIESEPDD